MQPEAAQAARTTTTTTHMQAEVNVDTAGPNTQAHVATSIKAEGCGRIDASLEVSTKSSGALVPAALGAQEAVPIDLEGELENLMQSMDVDMPQPEAEPSHVKEEAAPSPAATAACNPASEQKAPSSIATDAASEQKAPSPTAAAATEQLEALSGLIQTMLRRPNTIDINEVMMRANSLQSEPETNSTQETPRRRLTSKQPPLEVSSSTAPGIEASSTVPVKEASSTAQVKEASSAAPVKEASSAAPVKEASSAAPVKEASSAAPVKAASSAAPVKEASSAAPAEPGNDVEAPPNKKNKRDRKDETEEQRLAREGHNQYMRFYRSIRP